MKEITNYPTDDNNIQLNIYNDKNMYFTNLKSIKDFNTLRSSVYKTNIGSVLIKEIQQDPITNQIYHISGQLVAENDTIKTFIPIKFVNWENNPIKKKNQVIANYNNLHCTVQCKKLPSYIEFDFSSCTETKKIFLSEIAVNYPEIKFKSPLNSCILKIVEIKTKN